MSTTTICPIVEILQDKVERVKFILDKLTELYPDPACALDHRSPFELICATMLSAQCTDAQVNKVTPQLFAKYPDAKALSNADLSELEEVVRSTGFYKNKAKNLVNMAKSLMEYHNGEVPATLDELVKLAGVGRKTANVVLGNAFHMPGMVVDTHVTRLSNRFALVDTEDAVKIEFELMKIIPRERWVDFSHQLILLGREFCSAKKTRCEICAMT
ncbi:MAG: endonuclease III [Deferribacteraceae bacterium]|jgi:endonuclease-3|nr:endonuclease III [Deferribacteraceae bacterium]